MTTTELTKPQTRLLERIASAAEPLPVTSRSLASAEELVGLKLVRLKDGQAALTAAGRKLADARSTSSVDEARSPRDGSKAALVVRMLGRDEGASISALSEATGWLPHSVRGFLAGALRKTHGLSTTSGLVEGVRVYRLAQG